MQLKNFLISEDQSLHAALALLESNHQGFILTTNSSGAVTGLVTDGDLRRTLLEVGSLNTSVGACANTNFIWADQATPREILLKQLDNNIRVIPLLDGNRHLIGFVSRDHMPAQSEKAVYARARAPVRISFGGGGSDVTHYFSEVGGAVINATISLYSHAIVRMREDKRIIIKSLDLDETLFADDLTDALKQEGKFKLILSLLKVVRPVYGFELSIHSDFPMGSGLGGSAVVSASILGCFNQFRRDQWDQHELAELAFQAERLHLGVTGGWQDQYATVFGGFNFLEFRMDQNIVHPLRLHSTTLMELEESLILCDTGTTHDSGDIHLDQRLEMQKQDIRDQVQMNVELTYRMRNLLLRGRLYEFGQSLHESWQIKRRLSSKISNQKLDEIYKNALEHGALGGKLLGAGGGGFFLFFVPPYNKHQLISHLVTQGLQIRPFRFESEGLQAWTARERKETKEVC